MYFFAKTPPGSSSRKRNKESSADIDKSIDLTKVSSFLKLHNTLTCPCFEADTLCMDKHVYSILATEYKKRKRREKKKRRERTNIQPQPNICTQPQPEI